MNTKPNPMPEPASKERLRLWLRMLKTTRLIEAEVRENLRTQFGTTLPRFDVMSALNQYPDGLKMSELSSVLKVSNGNVTGIVDRLATDGLIQRETVPGDRRVNRVSLTATGRTEFAKQAQAHENWINQLMQDVSPSELAQAAQTLRDISDTPFQIEEA